MNTANPAPERANSDPLAGPLGRPLASTTSASAPRNHVTGGRSADTEQLPATAAPSTSGRRVGSKQLLALADLLSGRDLAVMETVERFRLVRGDQLCSLHFHEIRTPLGAERIARRSLQRLVEHRLLARTERRVGGVRAGSKSHTYLLTPLGRRIVALAQGNGPVSDRGLHEPGERFHRHTLAITDLYVQLVQADREGQLELLQFDPEPHCWRPTAAGGPLKPDAFVVVAVGDYEHLSMVEIDLATESRATLRRKLEIYTTHHATGVEQHHLGLFPHVAWLAPTPARRSVVDELIRSLPDAARRLFTSGLLEQPISSLTGGGTP